MAFYSLKATCIGLLYSLIVYLLVFYCCADANQTSILVEINHGVSGGLWAELVRNRGFEAGVGTTSNIYPWSIIGDNSSIYVSTDLTSCFERNKVALQIQVLCGDTKPCPSSGVGISNPGFWGMNIEKGKKYKIVFYVKALAISDLKISFTGFDGVTLASTTVT
ncbi:putative glycosidase [Lupinus albus]|uniref:Putative glycosidase n=1 Tax=Lupinus albus TaxID=3870 RepID=A0A6A4NMT7_LUPAL|nr:putative glycosidase [Lupinus albus]